MSLENEEPHSPDQPTETNHEMPKESKILYTREFLLSFSELDACKKLPSGFDLSIISEFEEAFKDRQRTSGLSAHSFRRNEYGSSPPTRGDVAGYSRPIHGRWEGRSTGRSDKDSDSQSDRDSDSGRNFGNQSRRPWQVPEHDGLLGSGSFPRPAGLTAGISAPKVRPNEPYQLNRTNEPYHPPRPYKAAPHSRRDTDSFNDETFGSSELTSEERAEEERKRRASFELMRKEQHKALQEQKLKPEKNKGDFDFSTLVDDKDERRHRSSEVEERLIPPASNTDSEKSSFLLQTAAPRPLVPPGFATTVLERNLVPKSLSHPHEVEVGNSELEENILHAKSKPVLNGTFDNQVDKQSTEQMIFRKQQHGSESTHASVDSMSEKNRSLSPPQGALNKIIGIESQLYNIANTSQALEASRNSEVIDLNAEKVMGTKIVGESNQGPSASILEKLFTKAVALNGVGSSNITEHQDIKDDETRSSDTAHSSKFARWFHEEERKPSDDFSSGRRNDLLSLIVGGEKGGSHISDEKIHDHSFPSFSSQTSEPADRVMKSDEVSPTVGNSEQLSKNNKPEAVSTVLTCEDLEQSILSGISENGPILQPPVQKWSRPGAGGKSEQLKANVDNNASQHLLSLLQKGTGLKDMEPSYNQETTYSEKLHDTEGATIGTAVRSSKKEIAVNVSDAGKNLTLETLFGTAFMKELQTVGAPVSVKRGPIGSARVDPMEPHGVPFPVTDNSLIPPAIQIGPNSTSHSSSDLTANRRKQPKSDMIEERWLGLNNPLIELGASQVGTDLGSKIGVFEGHPDFRLPEEDSLIAASEPLNIQNFMPSGNQVKSKLFSSPNTQVDIVEKLAAMNSAFKDERSMGSQEVRPPFLRGHYDMREPDNPYQNLNVQPSSQQLHHPQLNHVGPPFHPLDSHPGNINSQMNFMGPEGIMRSEPPPNHQFHANMLRPPFHHPNTGQSGFDVHTHHPMMQQMHMQGNFPPPHLLQGLSSSPPQPPHPNRGAPLPAHPNSQAFMQELNPMQGFPFGPRQPNFGGHGMPSPAPDVAGGSNHHPEALQRLIEMELRSNPKQIHQFTARGHTQGTYGHELDMGFGYR